MKLCHTTVSIFTTKCGIPECGFMNAHRCGSQLIKLLSQALNPKSKKLQQMPKTQDVNHLKDVLKHQSTIIPTALSILYFFECIQLHSPCPKKVVHYSESSRKLLHPQDLGCVLFACMVLGDLGYLWFLMSLLWSFLKWNWMSRRMNGHFGTSQIPLDFRRISCTTL